MRYHKDNNSDCQCQNDNVEKKTSITKTVVKTVLKMRVMGALGIPTLFD